MSRWLLRTGLGLCLSLPSCSEPQGEATDQGQGGSAGTGAVGQAGSGPSAGTAGQAQGGGAGAGGTSVAGGGSGAGGWAQAGGTAGAASQLSSCALAFPYETDPVRGTWLGGDSNFSLALSPTTALITFQDTFVTSAMPPSRVSSPIVSNTVAIASCNDEEYAIEYHWSADGDNHHALFDDLNPDGDRLWIVGPWLHDGRVFLTATRVGSGGELGFEEHGMTLCRVNNPYDAPASWDIDYVNLTDQRATVGKGVLKLGDYIYLFTPHDGGMLLTRIELQLLLGDAISEATLEYLAADGAFKPGLDLEDARQLGIPANTGLTVRYHEGSARWLALYVTTSGWPSSDIAVSSAESLEGPWSTPEVVYQMPEMLPSSDVYDVDNTCYGGAEHVVFNPDPDGRLLFTYTCNSLDFDKQVANLDIYLPVLVDIPNPLAN